MRMIFKVFGVEISVGKSEKFVKRVRRRLRNCKSLIASSWN
jgi:hypothetical protein